MAGRSQLDAWRRRYGLPVAAVDRLRTLWELVISDPRAPTAVRDVAGVRDDHLADSLVALELLPRLGRLRRAVDIGSGAGFPGLPLAIARPEVEFVLLESASRKCAFIEAAIAACGVGNARVVQARAEEWPEDLGRLDLAMARAVAPMGVVLEYAAPLLRMGGHLIAWRGRRDPAEEQRAAQAAAELGMAIEDVVRATPYAGAEHRHLHVARKASATPPRFPRRPGVARKRPLGGSRPNTAP